MYRYKIVVEKDRTTGFLNAHKMPLKCHEDILIFYQKLPTFNPQYFYGKPYKRLVSSCDSENYRKGIKGYVYESDGRRHPRDVIKFNFPKKGFIKNSEKVEHPTQKPVALLEYLIKTYSVESETVLDTCVGAGTTAIAAINTGRKFIGFELNEKFFNIACERVKQAQDKLTLDFNGVIKVAE